MLKNELNQELQGPVQLSVWLNFTKDGKHGCSKNCEFCNFKENPIYMCPTEEELREFIDDYMQYSINRSILLSGGGDPLFDFEENGEKIKMILCVCEELGVSVVMQSGELDVIEREYDDSLSYVSAYYFSSEAEDEQLLELSRKLREKGKRVVISKILNATDDIESIDFDALDSWVRFYEPGCPNLLIRENYNHCFSEEENEEIRDIINERYGEDAGCFVKYSPHRKKIGKHIGLINDTVIWGHDFIFLNKNK